MTYKRFIVLLGIFLANSVLAVAQTPPARIVLAKEPVAPSLTTLPVSNPLPAASFLLYQDREKPLDHFSSMLAGVYKRDRSLVRFPLTEEFKTSFFTQSSIRLFQIWGGRLQLDAFKSSLHQQNTQFGSSGTGGPQYFRPLRQSYLGGPRSIDLSGISLSFHFGRDARTVHPIQTWRSLSQIVGTVLN